MLAGHFSSVECFSMLEIVVFAIVNNPCPHFGRTKTSNRISYQRCIFFLFVMYVRQPLYAHIHRCIYAIKHVYWSFKYIISLSLKGQFVWLSAYKVGQLVEQSITEMINLITIISFTNFRYCSPLQTCHKQKFCTLYRWSF